MAEQRKVKDATRAIEGTDLIARARRQARAKLAWMAFGWGILALFIVFLWRCLTGIFEYQSLTEVPLNQPESQEETSETP